MPRRRMAKQDSRVAAGARAREQAHTQCAPVSAEAAVAKHTFSVSGMGGSNISLSKLLEQRWHRKGHCLRCGLAPHVGLQ